MHSCYGAEMDACSDGVADEALTDADPDAPKPPATLLAFLTAAARPPAALLAAAYAASQVAPAYRAAAAQPPATLPAASYAATVSASAVNLTNSPQCRL